MTPNEIFGSVVSAIIAEQETIIGPIALEQAEQVAGLSVNHENRRVEITGNGTEVVERLVERYKAFFGPAAVEVCKEAARELLEQLPPQQVPQLLR